jgi:RNA polymerase sigma-70 factor (ECF subfamily)
MRTSGKACIAQGRATANCAQRRNRSRDELVRAIQAVANGDEEAFASVYAATAAKLYGIIVRIIRQRELAQDILQEVYLRIWRHAHTFDAQSGSPITWMATIARHRALDEARRRPLTLPIEECPEALSLMSEDTSLSDDEEKAGQDLAAALQRLSRDKRSMLVQAYCHGLTREEIAKRTGRPIPTVKTCLRRALAELRDYLIEQESTTDVAPTY